MTEDKGQDKFDILAATPAQIALDPNAAYWQSGAEHLERMLERFAAVPKDVGLALGLAGLLDSRKQVLRIARGSGSASAGQLAVMQEQYEQGRGVAGRGRGSEKAEETC